MLCCMHLGGLYGSSIYPQDANARGVFLSQETFPNVVTMIQA